MSDDSPGGETTGSDEIGPGPRADAVEPGSDRPSSDRLHRLLSNPRRRCVLSCLTERPDVPISVERLVDAVARAERSDPGPATHRRRVAIDLHHVQLPKLADAGVIEYDPLAETVRYDGPEALEHLLAATERIEEPGDG